MVSKIEIEIIEKEKKMKFVGIVTAGKHKDSFCFSAAIKGGK